MRDPGLSEAIQAVGGVSELARRVGISQPSVSNWDKVPAERVLAVESATGVARMRLRPDLYREPDVRDIDEVDLARAQEYGLLSTLLARAPDAELLARSRGLAATQAARSRACGACRSRHRSSRTRSSARLHCSSGSDAATCSPMRPTT